jgi:hypothetical protein
MATLKAGKALGSFTSRNKSPKISHIGTGTLNGAQTRVYANGGSSGAGSVLIDKIAAISSTSTKYTTIECTATYGVTPWSSGGMRGGGRDESQLIISNFSLFIDWVQGTVVYQGKYTFPGESAGYTEWQFYNGTSSISAAGGSVTMSATSDHMGRGPRSAVAPVLKYNNNRQVTGVPVIDGPSYLMGYFSLHSYTITTDDGINVTAAPTPAPADPETPEVAPVVGVKISELNAVDALQDDDLFVLSQDNASDGTYDASYNVKLSDLRAGLTASNILSVQGTPTSNTGAEAIWGSCTLTLPAGKKWGHIKLVATSYNGSSSTLMPLDVKIGSAVQSWVNTGKDKYYAFNNSDDAGVITMINEGTPSVIDADITLDFYAKNMSDVLSYRTIFAIAEFY